MKRRTGGMYAGGFFGGSPGGSPLNPLYPEGFLGGSLRGRRTDLGDDPGGDAAGDSTGGEGVTNPGDDPGGGEGTIGGETTGTEGTDPGPAGVGEQGGIATETSGLGQGLGDPEGEANVAAMTALSDPDTNTNVGMSMPPADVLSPPPAEPGFGQRFGSMVANAIIAGTLSNIGRAVVGGILGFPIGGPVGSLLGIGFGLGGRSAVSALGALGARSGAALGPDPSVSDVSASSMGSEEFPVPPEEPFPPAPPRPTSMPPTTPAHVPWSPLLTGPSDVRRRFGGFGVGV